MTSPREQTPEDKQRDLEKQVQENTQKIKVLDFERLHPKGFYVFMSSCWQLRIDIVSDDQKDLLELDFAKIPLAARAKEDKLAYEIVKQEREGKVITATLQTYNFDTKEEKQYRIQAIKGHAHFTQIPTGYKLIKEETKDE